MTFRESVEVLLGHCGDNRELLLAHLEALHISRLDEQRLAIVASLVDLAKETEDFSHEKVAKEAIERARKAGA